ncbi:ATP-binding protein [Streptomyces chrestomyceticus]|uniref:ATP-binding protein n=1 Tax=Streptomyces chrestomyceticus TaxID=68185 RepID=UPI0019CF63E7|nr:ATP-binding protein [Streptomyces chrestomyceticus]
MTLAPPERPPKSPEARRKFGFSLGNDDLAPKVARTVVVDLLRHTGHCELSDDVRLLVSELVTNVHLHTTVPIIRLDVSVQHSRVHVAVWDDAPGSRLLSLPAYGESGRGLRLVEALASRWGVYRPNIETRRRKGVWFAIDHRDRKDVVQSLTWASQATIPRPT